MASRFAIRHCAHKIRLGGVILYPTETVYGLGCDPMNADAVHYINQLKQREAGKGLILLADSLAAFKDYIEPLTKQQQKQLSHTEQPTSWIVNAKNSLPDWLSNTEQTVAIRISSHPVVTQLCSQLGHPLVSTSANPRGQTPCRDSLQAHQYFHAKVDAFLIDAKKLNGQPSAIKRLDNLLTLRT